MVVNHLGRLSGHGPEGNKGGVVAAVGLSRNTR